MVSSSRSTDHLMRDTANEHAVFSIIEKSFTADLYGFAFWQPRRLYYSGIRWNKYQCYQIQSRPPHAEWYSRCIDLQRFRCVVYGINAQGACQTTYLSSSCQGAQWRGLCSIFRIWRSVYCNCLLSPEDFECLSGRPFQCGQSGPLVAVMCAPDPFPPRFVEDRTAEMLEIRLPFSILANIYLQENDAFPQLKPFKRISQNFYSKTKGRLM